MLLFVKTQIMFSWIFYILSIFWSPVNVPIITLCPLKLHKFVRLTRFWALTSPSFCPLTLKLFLSNFHVSLLLTESLSLTSVATRQWYVSQSAPLKDGTSSTLEYHLLSTKMWSIWFSLQLQASPINNNCIDSNQYTIFSSVNDPKTGVRINQCLASKSGQKGFYTPVTVYCCDFKSFTNRCAEASDTQFARVNRHQDFEIPCKCNVNNFLFSYNKFPHFLSV